MHYSTGMNLLVLETVPSIRKLGYRKMFLYTGVIEQMLFGFL